MWLIEAAKHNVIPLDDRVAQRANRRSPGRPTLVRGNRQLLFGGMITSDNRVVSILNKTHAVTAEIEVPEEGAAGVIIAHGGKFGGWCLYAHNGKPEVLLQLLRSATLIVEVTGAYPRASTMRMEFTYDGGGLAKGGGVALYLDGERTGEGRVDGPPFGFSEQQ